jgi:hypothetical protein
MADDPLRILNECIRREFRTSLMSDTKWRKLFGTLDDNGLLPVCRIKFIDAPEPRQMARPSGSFLHGPLPYVDSESGPFALRSIEWIDFPRTVVIGRRPMPTRRSPVSHRRSSTRSAH